MDMKGCGESAPSAALDEPDLVLDTSCRMLLRTRRPLAVPDLAAALGREVVAVERDIADHERRGRMARDGDGLLVASAGVSVVPSDYDIHLGELRIWGLCAKTALGVVAALGVDATIDSRSPMTGVALRTEFVGSRVVPAEHAVFWPSDEFRDMCGSAAADYCPTFSIFEDEPTAAAWVERGGVPGTILPVAVAAERAAVRWRASLDMAGEGMRLATELRTAGARG